MAEPKKKAPAPAAPAKPVESQASTSSHLITPLAVVLILMVMLVPLPPAVLDILITMNLTISMVVLFVSMYIRRPVEFSVFPSLLLLLTLYRLALNIASTRLILLHGHIGLDAAGQVIRSFGSFVVAGNFAIGCVLFLILLAIQYIVISHGAVRISEVAARFTLDAMPGKQLSIDADLNAGLIGEAEARERRSAIAREAEFHGAMDGATRFTQRDSVASMAITAINIVAGCILGVFQHKLSLGEAASSYALLTIGDGLVTAIPALLISVSGGLITTRVADSTNLGDIVSSQLRSDTRPLSITAGVLGAMMLIPGVPKLPLLLLGGGLWSLSRSSVLAAAGAPRDAAAAPGARPGRAGAAQEGAENINEALRTDPLLVEVGFGLVPLIEEGAVLEKIRTIRFQLASEMGLIVPPIRVRDNLELASDEYRISLRGIPISSARLRPSNLLAMDTGGVRETISGMATHEPAFGLPALWISRQSQEQAQLVGYTVVDPVTVLVTHLAELLRRHSHELLGRQETQALLDRIAETSPKVVDDLVPKLLSLGMVRQVLQNLLRERVGIRDLTTILEAVADGAAVTQNVDLLTELVRQRIGRSICHPYVDGDGRLAVLHLSPVLEDALTGGLAVAGQEVRLTMPAEQSLNLLGRIKEAVEKATPRFVSNPVLLCSSTIRVHLKRLTESLLPHLVVLAHAEIPVSVNTVTLGMVN
jgi:flagellar biosynthesis protein FlhA